MSTPLLGPFQCWSLDLVGPIRPVTRQGYKYILVATDYITKWVEEKPLHSNTASITATFIFENIITIFGCPLEIVSDQSTFFVNLVIEDLINNYIIQHRTKTGHYLQGNGQVKPTNKRLLNMLRRFVHANQVDSDD